MNNSRGDVEALYNTSGSLVARYTYDTWGNIISIKNDNGNITSTTHIANLNPIRYKGYQYDNETGFYYLNSRYYDPKVGRFINADDSQVLTLDPTSLYDKNLYSYCDNNPVSRSDNDGDFWETAFDIASLLSSINDVRNNPDDLWAWTGLIGDTIDLIPFVVGVGETAKALKVIKKINKLDDVANVAETVNDTKKIANVVTGYTKHGINQAISKNDVGVSPAAILDAVKNPKKITSKIDNYGRMSMQYRGKISTVVLNTNGEIISCWSKSSKYWRIKR